jgi:hypothetical protein
MQIRSIIQEIQKLPLDKRFFVIEQTLKSIKKEEFKHQKIDELYNDDAYIKELNFPAHLVSEKSLATDWLSEEDKRWDNIL